MTKAIGTRPHRIALVITELEVGGAERCLTNLALRIDKTRFLPTVFSLAPPPKRPALVEQLMSAGITPTFLNATSMADAWSALRNLQRHLSEAAPALVQTFLFHANVFGSRAAKRAGVPHIVHGVRVADPSLWRQRVEKYCARDVDRVVCVSDAVAEFLKGKAGYTADKLIVIPNGIDLERFVNQAVRQDPLPDSESREKILIVARLHQQKGIEWLLRAMPSVFEQIPNVDLMIAGTGPEEASLKALVHEQGMARRVQFLGWRADVPELLQASKLFLLPSRWEGMSNALLEAMASGLPVISTRSEGSAELLGKATHPQLVDYGDAQGLVDRTLAILRSPQQAKELGVLNREQAARFSLERMVSKYEVLYTSLLENR